MTLKNNTEGIEPYCPKDGRINPNDSDAYYNCGIKLDEQGRTEEAIVCYRNAVRINPYDVDAYYNLGVALNTLGKSEDAIESYKKVLELKPNDFQAYNNMGITLKSQLKLTEAALCFQKVIANNPKHIQALNNMGYIRLDQDKADEALSFFQKVIDINPDDPETYSNMGTAFNKLGKLEKAIWCFTKAIKIEPKYARAYNNLGAALQTQGELDKAISCFLKLIEINPDDSNAYFHIGNTFNLKGKKKEALTYYQKAVEINSDHAPAFNNMGNTLKEQGKYEKALQCFETAIAISPDDPNVNYNLALILHSFCKTTEGLSYLRKTLQVDPKLTKAQSNILYYLNFDPDYSHSLYLQESKTWWKNHGTYHANLFKHNNIKDHKKRLRIGYVSPDFHRHSVSWFFLPLLMTHNRSKIEVFCYSDTTHHDDITEQIKGLTDHWCSSSNLSDEELANQIFKDSIDILVDLSGHSGNNRLPVFAQKPAPVQVSWLGYPNTTGLPTIDYRLTDSISDPEGIGDNDYTETLVRLPNGFLCYAPHKEAPEINRLLKPNPSAIEFGSFNNLAKINSNVISLWSAILHKAHGSCLVLKTKELVAESTRRRYLDMFHENGIDSSRIKLLSSVPSLKDHLSLYNDVDIALDPFPYNGTTTTCEALWMGTPAITLRGDRHASRVGASILSRINMTELIAENEEDYVLKAVELANNLARVTELRNSLRHLMINSPLCDPEQFAHDIESAFRQMWNIWCETKA